MHPSTASFANTRVWFITGCSKGIGRSVLEAVLASGERAVATLRTPAVLTSLQEKYPSEQLVVIAVDVTNKEQVTEAFETTKKAFGRLDIVLNNAGFGLFCEAEGTPEAEAREQMEVGYWAPINISLQAIKFMRETNIPGRPCRRIFNMSTMTGYAPLPCLSFYTGARAALEGWSDSVNKELDPKWNIKLCILEPGPVNTAWVTSSLVAFPPIAPYATPESPMTHFRAWMATAALPGSPEKIAAAILQLSKIGADELPFRVQFGAMCFDRITQHAKQTISDAEKWKKLCIETDE